jgi:hypothetical protein
MLGILVEVVLYALLIVSKPKIRPMAVVIITIVILSLAIGTIVKNTSV